MEHKMSKTWFSYTVLAIGVMLFVASDKPVTADDAQSARTVSFGTDKTMEIIVNKAGTSVPNVKVIINGDEHAFTIPELNDGEEREIITEDGQKIIIKSISGNNMVWIDGDEINLPPLGNTGVSPEGLSALIGRSHQIKMSNGVTISANGLSKDVEAAILEAVKGVLTSYNVDKSVSYQDQSQRLHMMRRFGTGGEHESGNYKFEFKTDGELHTDTDKDVRIMFIEDNKVVRDLIVEKDDQ